MKHFLIILSLLLTISVFSAPQYDSPITLKAGEMNIFMDFKNGDKDNNIEYGLYYFDEINTPGTNWIENVNFWKIHEGDNLLSFNKDVALYVKDKKGNYHSSLNPSKYFSINSSGNIIINSSKWTNETIELRITTVGNKQENAPNGQPLPGIIATLLTGVLFFIYFRMKKGVVKHV